MRGDLVECRTPAERIRGAARSSVSMMSKSKMQVVPTRRVLDEVRFKVIVVFPNQHWPFVGSRPSSSVADPAVAETWGLSACQPGSRPRRPQCNSDLGPAYNYVVVRESRGYSEARTACGCRQRRARRVVGSKGRDLGACVSGAHCAPIEAPSSFVSDHLVKTQQPCLRSNSEAESCLFWLRNTSADMFLSAQRYISVVYDG